MQELNSVCKGSKTRVAQLAIGMLRMLLVLAGLISVFAVIWGSDRPWPLVFTHALYAFLFIVLGAWGFESVNRWRMLFDCSASITAAASIVAFHFLRIQEYGPGVSSLLGVHSIFLGFSCVAMGLSWWRFRQVQYIAERQGAGSG